MARDFLPLGFCGSLVKRSGPTLVESQYSALSGRLAVMIHVVNRTSLLSVPASLKYCPDQEVVNFPSYKARKARNCSSDFIEHDGAVLDD